jgi:hypothetical protein
MQAGGQTDMMKLKGVFLDYKNAPEKCLQKLYMILIRITGRALQLLVQLCCKTQMTGVYSIM